MGIGEAHIQEMLTGTDKKGPKKDLLFLEKLLGEGQPNRTKSFLTIPVLL